jgi:hypothetical protein
MKRKGICYVCGCTEFDACDEGCGWANLKKTLCTACVALSPAERLAKKADAVSELSQRYDQAREEELDLERRLAVLQSEGR